MKYLQGFITGGSLMLCFFLLIGAKQKAIGSYDDIYVKTIHAENIYTDKIKAHKEMQIGPLYNEFKGEGFKKRNDVQRKIIISEDGYISFSEEINIKPGKFDTLEVGKISVFKNFDRTD